jgi:xanthine dehydrogenase YagS FAD-binding subunit
MQPFTFTRAHNREAAVNAAAEPHSCYIGGGTNLVDLMRSGVERPARVIDINSLPMDAVQTLPDGSIRIGALVRNSDLAWHPLILERYPMLSQAILAGASAQLRNMATTGGNVLQRTRCPYFYDLTYSCNKRTPGAGCAAIDGYNRSHAVLGTSDACIATHPSDMCVALAALDAVIHVQGRDATRVIPFRDFHLLPGNTPGKETALRTGELITAVDIPPLPFARRSGYLKVRDRASYAFALASAAVALDIDNGTIRAARIALGGIGTRPWRSPEAEQALQGAAAGETAYRNAASAALAGARPYRHNAFKIDLAKRTLVSALSQTQNFVI